MEKPRILIVREPIKLAALEPLRVWHKKLIKGAADVERRVVALGGDWHMDANVVLLADESKQQDVWGFNIYPDERNHAAVEYTSLVNIRPAQGNREMEIGDVNIRKQVRSILEHLLPELFV